MSECKHKKLTYVGDEFECDDCGELFFCEHIAAVFNSQSELVDSLRTKIKKERAKRATVRASLKGAQKRIKEFEGKYDINQGVANNLEVVRVDGDSGGFGFPETISIKNRQTGGIAVFANELEFRLESAKDANKR